MTTDIKNNSFVAQDMAGKAILFEIGAKAGIVNFIERNQKVTVRGMVAELGIKPDFLQTYVDTLENLELLSKEKDHTSGEEIYARTAAFHTEKNKIGYIAWGMQSCAPLIANTKAFTDNFDTAVRTYHRCGEHVARTSKWMGENDFYPHAEDAILALNPKKVVDLGSGTCGLLMRLAQELPKMTGTGVDLSKDACDEAQVQLTKAGLADRINVVHAPIQKLVERKEVFLNADVIHAGFVFHDLMPEDEKILDALLKTINTTAPAATLVIVDAIPFSKNTHERAFSSAFSFLHKYFMGRQLQSETEWVRKLKHAGFNNIAIKELGISGGRIFTAKI